MVARPPLAGPRRPRPVLLVAKEMAARARAAARHRQPHQTAQPDRAEVVAAAVLVALPLRLDRLRAAMTVARSAMPPIGPTIPAGRSTERALVRVAVVAARAASRAASPRLAGEATAPAMAAVQR